MGSLDGRPRRDGWKRACELQRRWGWVVACFFLSPLSAGKFFPSYGLPELLCPSLSSTEEMMSIIRGFSNRRSLWCQASGWEIIDELRHRGGFWTTWLHSMVDHGETVGNELVSSSLHPDTRNTNWAGGWEARALAAKSHQPLNRASEEDKNQRGNEGQREGS